MDETSQGRGGIRAVTDDGSEDEAETSTTWRAYRATTIDTEEMINSGTGALRNTEAQRGGKPSPAEVSLKLNLHMLLSQKCNQL